MSKKRCDWGTSDEIMIRYHDEEWGVPVHDDRKHFEFLVLESFQAGLSWMTILKKRENFRKAFARFDPDRVSRYGKEDIERLLTDRGIIRNRKKIEAAIENAKAFLSIQEEFGSFDSYIWDFVGGKPIRNRFRSSRELPA
jgi:DNA-3-methyladenine glycosylase I